MIIICSILSILYFKFLAENLAKKYNITREEQDQSAVRSQELAAKAQKNGYFEEEIIAVPITDRNGTIIFSEDEYLKLGTTLDSLKKLRPCFVKVNKNLHVFYTYIYT